MKETAILMAAGLGARMRPLTDTIAKPLVPVRGVPLVETVLAALEKRGVDEMYAVVGYKKEQFVSLLDRHPRLQLVENPFYETKNNISSIAAVTDKMRGGPCFICEADLYIPSPDLLLRPLSRSGFFARFVPGHSDDWLFDLDDSRRILAFHKGGDDKYNLSGISWFTATDAAKVADIIDAAIRDPANDQCFWDETVCRHASEIDMTIHEVTDADIVECDTPEDLRALEARLP